MPEVECDEPIFEGNGFTQNFDRELFINHYLYWPVAFSTAWNGELSQNQLDWINEVEGAYWTAQTQLAALTSSSTGDYVRKQAPFGSSVLYWLAPIAQWSQGDIRVDMSAQAFDAFEAVFTQMDCCMEFIRGVINV